MKKNPASPSKNIVNDYLKEWETLEKYTLQESSLGLLFNKLCPNNKNIKDILLKVSALNDFYSTNIYDTFTVSKHILDCNIDHDLKNKDKSLVNKIALIKMKGGREINFYSFASKYCCHHLPDIYPIYDSYVEKMLMYFKKKDKFYPFIREDLKKYNIFLEVISKFQHHYNLENFTLREIDIYLWLAGKEYFPNKYI